MILFINTSKTDLIQVKLIKDDQIIGQLENHEEYKQSELLLSIIDNLLKQKRIKIESLKFIAVVTGPGAFSALRLGVTTANTLAWSLKIPIIELSVEDVENDEILLKNLKAKVLNPQSLILTPKYGKEPNITHSTPSPNSSNFG